MAISNRSAHIRAGRLRFGSNECLTAMDIELTHVHVTYPAWFKLALVGTFVFPFVAIPLSRRVRDPVALLMVLIAGNLAATWAGLLRLSQNISLSGAGHRAASAGGA